MTSEALKPFFVFFHDLVPVSHYVYFRHHAAKKPEQKEVGKLTPKAMTNNDLKQLKPIWS